MQSRIAIFCACVYTLLFQNGGEEAGVWFDLTIRRDPLYDVRQGGFVVVLRMIDCSRDRFISWFSFHFFVSISLLSSVTSCETECM